MSAMLTAAERNRIDGLRTDGLSRGAILFLISVIDRLVDGHDQQCAWKQGCDGEWESSCGECWVFDNAGPVENGVKYCHGCGKPVKPVPYVDEANADGIEADGSPMDATERPK